MKKVLWLFALLSFLAFTDAKSQTLTFTSYDTTSVSDRTTIKFSKGANPARVALFYNLASDSDSVGMPQKTIKVNAGPFVLSNLHLEPNKTYWARLKGYQADTLAITTPKFVFKSNTVGADSCSKPSGLKATTQWGKVYLSWNSGFLTTYTIHLKRMDLGTTATSTSTTCSKVISTIGGVSYQWWITGTCTGGGTQTSAVAKFIAPLPK